MIDDLKPYPGYKESNIPWLGQIPEHWHVERGKWLFRKMDRPVQEQDEVVTCFRDGVVTLRKNRRVRGFTEALQEIGYQGIRRGDLVIHAMDAFAGAIGVADSDGKGSPVYSVCQPIAGVNSYYYAYIVREMARRQWIMALARGIRERSTDFRFEGFASQRLPLPAIEEQSVIVRFLKAADQRIARHIRAKQSLIALLEEEKRAVIHRAVTIGLDPTVHLRPSGIDWIGDTPEHWQIKRVKQVSKVLRGKFTHRPRNDPELYGGPYPFLQTGDVARASKLITSFSQTLNDRGLAVSKLFPRGTLAMAIAANIGDVAILDFDACFPDSVVGFVPRAGIDRDFLYYVFLSMKAELLLEAPVNTQGNLNIERIGSRALPVPPLAEQKQIVHSIEGNARLLDVATSTAAREIGLVREYRTRLIADVVTGKLDVREAAAKLPDEAAEPVAPGEAEVLVEGEDIGDEALEAVEAEVGA